MKKKRIIIIAGAALLVIAAVVICFRMFGGSHTGIDNNPESKLSDDSNVLVAYFSWSGNGQQMARWISEETGGDLFRIIPEEPYGEDLIPVQTGQKMSWIMVSDRNFRNI